MRKICLLLALCLMLSIFAGCSSEEPAETTAAPIETTAAPVETTEPPTVETTEPPVPVVIDYELELPEGFEASLVASGLTVFSAPNARVDDSTIQVEVLEHNEAVLALDEDEFTSRFTFQEETDETTEPEETEETHETEETTEPAETEPALPEDLIFYDLYVTQVDGWDALFTDYTLVYEDHSCHTYRYEVVTTEANYVFTFADTTANNDWLDLYKDCVDTIDFVLDTEGIELDYSNLTRYDLSCGLSVYAEAGMEEHNPEGFTACLGNRNVIILMMADDKAANNLTEMALKDYADLVAQTNGLERFNDDVYGNILTTYYSTDENGLEYYNMICVKETEEDFWVVQMACMAEDQASYARAFSLWASSIAEK